MGNGGVPDRCAAVEKKVCALSGIRCKVGLIR